jgi:hypothetical protein
MAATFAEVGRRTEWGRLRRVAALSEPPAFSHRG